MSTSAKVIVVFKKAATPKQISDYITRVKNEGGDVTNEYDPDILRGFAAVIPDTLLKSFQSDDIIDYIEPDGVVTIQDA